MMSATSKSFNLAGLHTGNVIIPDPKLRETFGARMMALGISPNSFGVMMATAAYSAEGAAWIDALMEYIAENVRIFDEGIEKIPGLKSMPLEGTYLSWVDFSGTGMEHDEIARRIAEDARIAVNDGPPFGHGGELFMRFNLATQKSRVVEAVSRMQQAFSDLQ